MIERVPQVIIWALGALVLLGFCAFSVQSLREKERRAAAVSLALALSGAALIWSALLLPHTGRLVLLGILALFGGLAVILFLLPIGRVDRGEDRPTQRVDERDIMFARRPLVPGSSNYEAYYSMHPENKEADDQIRSLPGLFSPSAAKAHPLNFPAGQASFTLCDALIDHVDGPTAEKTTECDPAFITDYIKGFSRYLGALSVGVAEVKPYHIYSHIGRGRGEYGAPIELGHRFAVAYTVEMDYDMMGPAPDSPEVMETGRQYAEAAKIGVQLAAFIRRLGYPARAHIDGNYRVIAPLVARDAGLGEIGRMGILMTPRLGPRVRLGVVTTDLPLMCDERWADTSAIDFCRICRKCAENCPSRSIPFEDRQEIDGALRWRIDAASCYRYWNIVGTDCGRCMAVCPYSHPDNAAHNVVRWAIGRSGFARRAAFWMDDLFYGKRPAKRPAPAWTRVEVSPKLAENPD